MSAQTGGTPAGIDPVMDRWIINAVLLDMDGTLLDTEKVYLESSIAALAACGYTDGAAALCHSMIGIPDPTATSSCARILETTSPPSR